MIPPGCGQFSNRLLKTICGRTEKSTHHKKDHKEGGSSRENLSPYRCRGSYAVRRTGLGRHDTSRTASNARSTQYRASQLSGRRCSHVLSSGRSRLLIETRGSTAHNLPSRAYIPPLIPSDPANGSERIFSGGVGLQVTQTLWDPRLLPFGSLRSSGTIVT
jgi:hypothetical protein